MDFVVVGAGAAGGVVARELSRSGFRVVVLEQGPYLREGDFHHDEIETSQLHALTNDPRVSPTTFRTNDKETATRRPVVSYGRMVGGGTAHFTANYWRFHEIDFVEHSKKGSIAGADRDDWPITYAELEPYYTKVEWEIGVSGLAGASPFDPPRSKPYPLPPLPIKPAGRARRAWRSQAGVDRVPCTDGDSLAAVSRPIRLRALRILRDIRLRDAREVEHVGLDDSRGRGDWPL